MLGRQAHTHVMADSVEHNLELTTSALKDGPADLGLRSHRGGLHRVADSMGIFKMIYCI